MRPNEDTLQGSGYAVRGFCDYILGSGLPFRRRALDAVRPLAFGPEQWGWVVGSFVITYPLFALPAAALGDRYGTRKVLALIVLWWSLFTFLTGAAVNFQ